MNEAPKLMEVLMLLATVSGPLVGIWVTRWIDRANDRVRKREAVFEAMIRTRGLELSQEHVSNLNMVPLLFKEGDVRSAYSRIMEVVNGGTLTAPEEAVRDAAMRRLVDARRDMIRAIGHAVKTPLPESETERHGYAPQGWIDEQLETQTLRRAATEFFAGRSAAHMIAGIWQVPEPPKDPDNPILPGEGA